MKFVFAFVFCAALLTVFGAAAQDHTGGKSTAVLDTDLDKISYVIGLQFGSSMREAGMEISLPAMTAAIEDALKDREPAMSEEEMQASQEKLREIIMAKREEMMKKQQEENAAAGAKNTAAAEEFLKENGVREGVKTTASGLQYEVLKDGDGPMPKASDTVSVHYKGTLLDGTVFDSSYDRGEPATFQVGQLIPGWVEALPMMKAGSKWKLFIHPDLGYGDRDMGQITPGSLLIFEMELLEVKGAANGGGQTITIN